VRGTKVGPLALDPGEGFACCLKAPGRCSHNPGQGKRGKRGTTPERTNELQTKRVKREGDQGSGGMRAKECMRGEQEN
jgi:hypothetical protein